MVNKIFFHIIGTYWFINRGVSGYLKLGGQVVMWRAAAVARQHLLFCQKLVGQLPTRH